jgi:ABC-type branched-subunit amino acid transport system substrate-binding protein
MLVFLGCFQHVHAQEGLNPREMRGKQIYLKGASDTGAVITARVGKENVELPASAVPCAGCHGPDGRGRPEGGVLPSDITWGYLTRVYGHQHPFGRKHPAFLESTVAAAITLGVDPAGNRLDAAMPRYAMTAGDMADLVAYLKRLEKDSDAGLSATTVRVGTLLPLQGPLGELGLAMRDVMRAYFDDLNAGGGIYGRRIELVVADTAGTTATADLGERIAGMDVFALVSPLTAGYENRMAALSEAEALPVIGPFTLLPQDSYALNRYNFYLFAGLSEQARVLVWYAADELHLDAPAVAIVYPQGGRYDAVVTAVTEQCRNRGWPAAKEQSYPAGAPDARQLVQAARGEAVTVVFFLGSGQELEAYAQQAAQIGWSPYLLVPGALADSRILNLPDGFSARVFLAYPTLQEDHSSRALAELQALRKRHHLSGRHPLAEISAYSAARVLVEGLKRSGRATSREKLVDALETIHALNTGLTPPLSFGTSRRIGALGAYVVGVDLKNERLLTPSAWLELER